MFESFKISSFKKIFDRVLSLILPKNREVEHIESMSGEEILLNLPKADEIKDSRLKAMFQYRDKTVKSAIWAIKYSANKIITERFSELLYEFILEDLSDEIMFSNFTKPLVIPIPAGKNSLKERGYNQCELITNSIILIDNEGNFEINTKALKKIKETAHQSKTKNKSERLKNLQDSFSADSKIVSGRNIILIDDVITTGATMNEASRSLKSAGAKKVIGFAIAH